MPTTPEGFKQILVFTDIERRFRLAYLLKKRSEATRAIVDETTAIARHFGHVPTRLRVDNANELLSKSIQKFCAMQGKVMRPTVAHTPQENDGAERVFRPILGRIRATLTAADMQFAKYWVWAALDTVTKMDSC